MATPRHLPNAPITEAIVDFRVKASPDLEIDQLRNVHASLADRFPQVIELKSLEAQVQFSAQRAPQPTVRHHGVVGFHFKSDDGLNIAQFRVDGFTYNRLRPYTSWNQILPAVLELWDRYKEVAGPQMVTRLALRYVNRIGLPSDLEDFADVMTAPPPIPDPLPQHVSGFLTRVTVHDVEHGVAAHISQALETGPSEKRGRLILDIDGFKQNDWEISSPEIPETFEVLRRFKNTIFFESLTERTIERFL